MGKSDDITPEMRRRLITNRNGKLTSDQWMDLTTEPLVGLLLLLPPLILLFGSRVAIFKLAFWIVILLGLAALVAPAIFRARRYARAPVYFDTFYARSGAAPFWKFWRPPVLFTASGEERRFARRLAPYFPLRAGQPYHVYFLTDSEESTLLSIAPANHPDAGQWQPTEAFAVRLGRRGGRPASR